MKTSPILLFFLLLSLNLSAQNISRYDCKISIDGKTIEYPFTGGLNAPHFNKMDINLDGVEDLIVFDRVGNKLSVFINNNGKYVFAPEYISSFPPIEYWMLLVDYNHDGLKDLFKSSGSTDIEAWKAVESNGKIHFEKYKNPYFSKDVLSRKKSSGIGHFEIEHLQSDIPAIIDIDNDGDLDVLTFSTGKSVKLYKNICVEKKISLDSFLFIFTNNCWGRFVEDNFSSKIHLSKKRYQCADQLFIAPRHAGSTTLIFDIDDDGDYDVLIGDIEYDSLIFLRNGGDAKNAWMTEIDRHFPSYDKPIALKSFLAASYIDVDFDGNKDLIITPNEDYDISHSPQNINNVYFYKNIESNKKPKFKFVKNDFLVGDILDLGGNVYPTFVDVNADGLLDIVVGISPQVKYENISPSKLYYFKNTGTKTKPKFQLEDNDYLNLSSISFQKDLNYFTPSFGDLDGDGDMDLVLGNNTGTLIYLKNIAGKDNTLEFDAPIINYKNIDVESFSAPCIFDHNKDGLGDLIIGVGSNFHDTQKNLGAAVYFENTGNLGDANFNSDVFTSPNNPFYGELDYNEDFSYTSYAYFSTYIDKENNLLFAGFKSGGIDIFKDFVSHRYNKLTPFIKKYGAIDIGNKSAPAVADIDNDGYLEILIGTETGGFEFWNTDIKISNGTYTTKGDLKSKIKIYPNPTQDYIFVQLSNSILKSVKYKLTNIWGETIKSGNLDNSNNKIELNMLQEGIYLLTLDSDGKLLTEKIVKTKK